MLVHPVINVDIGARSCPLTCKSPVQYRLESRPHPSSGHKSAQELLETVQQAERRRQAHVQARAEKSREQCLKAQSVCKGNQEALRSLTTQMADTIQKRMERAEINRQLVVTTSKSKTKNINLRVPEAQRRKEEIIGLQNAILESVNVNMELRLSSAEIRRETMLEESKDRAATEVAKAQAINETQKIARIEAQNQARIELTHRQKAAEQRREQVINELKTKAAQDIEKAREAAAKKKQSAMQLQTKLNQRLSAAEARRNNLVADQQTKAAQAVARARDVVAEQAKRELRERERLLANIAARHLDAEERRRTSSSIPSKLAAPPAGFVLVGRPAEEQEVLVGRPGEE